MKEKGYKLLWIAQGYLDAQIKKNYLLSKSIEVILFEESLGTIFGFTNTPLGEVEIYVKDHDFNKAIILLENLHSQEDDSVV